MYRLILFLFLVNIGMPGYADGNAGYDIAGMDVYQVRDSIIEPVIPGDFADPSVIRVGDLYYATGTSSEWAPHFPIYKSKDLIQWDWVGYIFNEKPEWTSSSFWAPELLYRDGIYYAYYTARKKSGGISCIGVATSTDPGEGFTDRGIVVDFGKEAIDAFVVEENGKWYITFKAYGLDPRPIELLGYELTSDGLRTVGEPFSLLKDDGNIGLEGQSLVKRDGFYYLFYSQGGCCGVDCSYRVSVARSRSVKGPYIDYENNPILNGFNGWKCTGHGTVVSDRQNRDFYLFHAYSKTATIYAGRQGMLARLNWDKQTKWPSFQIMSGNKPREFSDEFAGRELNNEWQWDFRHARPKVDLKNGALHLSGTTEPNNLSGIALTVRPFYANYEVTTLVVRSGRASGGLTLYSDADRALGIMANSDSVFIWNVQGENKAINNAVGIEKSVGAVNLKMKVIDGKKVEFFYQTDFGSDWISLEIGHSDLDEGFTPPWDRSSRPGIIQSGDEPAVFDYFKISYF